MCQAKIWYAYFQQVTLVTLKWFIPNVCSEMDLSWPTCWNSKTSKMLSLPDDAGWAPVIAGTVFFSLGIPPPLTLVSSCCLLRHVFFLFCSHIQHYGHGRAGLLSETKYDWPCWPELAFQRNNIIVKHMFHPCQIFWWPWWPFEFTSIVVKQNVWWCSVFDDNTCMWRRIVTLSGVLTN